MHGYGVFRFVGQMRTYLAVHAGRMVVVNRALMGASGVRACRPESRSLTLQDKLILEIDSLDHDQYTEETRITRRAWYLLVRYRLYETRELVARPYEHSVACHVPSCVGNDEW
ncbi:hypothetical protein M011DRAFT_276035 [Sporormia fimetaria CBS 119925]|uniref:Uncharacterized protein n=1 Tax=Sporormia fimetaria CBS 119925 TaxID=1340428 RepID=A0A6A6VHZ2_9PLEO|nr:hypothetical protein M011DRAFT_276035 [Sporormia fimetaria CBS 119925]